jgi:hypothetical protein
VIIVLPIRAFTQVAVGHQEKKEQLQSDRKIISQQGKHTAPEVLGNYIKVARDLYDEGKLTKYELLEVIDDIFQITEAHQPFPTAAKYKSIRIRTEAFYSTIIDCNGLDSLFTSLLNSKPDDRFALARALRLYTKKECFSSDAFFNAAGTLHKTAPGMLSAVSLAKIYGLKGDATKSLNYLNEAGEFESDITMKAALFFDAAVYSRVILKNFNQAKVYALRAGVLRPGWGKPWMLIGDLYAENPDTCDSASKLTPHLWAAVDKYNYAKSIDSTIMAEANRKISFCSKRFPQAEMPEIELKEGDPFHLNCWINERTTVRFRK